MAINKVFYRTPHNYDLEAASNEASVKDFGASLTVQSMADDVDINVIMKRFGVTGQLPENFRPLTYGDFTEPLDFRGVQERYISARDHFMEMPAELRARFGNDPQMFLEFCEARDEKGARSNLEEMRKLGFALPEEVPVPEKVSSVRIVSDERPTAGTTSVPPKSSPAGGSSAP